jgi:hypothetical protein
VRIPSGCGFFKLYVHNAVYLNRRWKCVYFIWIKCLIYFEGNIINVLGCCVVNFYNGVAVSHNRRIGSTTANAKDRAKENLFLDNKRKGKFLVRHSFKKSGHRLEFRKG